MEDGHINTSPVSFLMSKLIKYLFFYLNGEITDGVTSNVLKFTRK